MEEKFLGSIRNCVVIACCYSLGMFIFGIARLSAQLFVSCMERYNVGRKEASFPFALSYTIRNVSGPLIGYLGQKFGAEEVTLVGCVLSIIGVGACFFAEDIFAVIVLWGCVYGFGFGLGTVLVEEILRTYFTKHYGKAVGIYSSSAPISSLFFPFIMDILFDTYGTSGTFLVLSGLMMHSIATSIILINFKRRSGLSKTEHAPTTIESNADRDKAIRENELSWIPVENIKQSSKISSDDFFSQKLGTKSEMHYNSAPSETEEATVMILSEVKKAPAKGKDENLLLKMLLMFLDPTFIIISITLCILVLTFAVIGTVVIDYSRDAGVSTDQEIFVFMALVVGDIVGRLTLGAVTDAGYVSKKNFSAFSFILLGVSIWSLSIVHSFILVTLTMCAVGLFAGGGMMISSGIVIKYIEMENVLLVFGCRLFPYPIFGFAQPYLIAYSRDVLGSYNGLFYFLAAINVVSGVLTLLLPVTTRFKEKRKKSMEKSLPLM